MRVVGFMNCPGRQSLLVSALVISAMLGCSSGVDEDLPPVYPTTGVVFQNGSPLADATVMFTETFQDKRTAIGKTDVTGRFTLTTFSPNDGAIAGKHVVTVRKVVEGEPDANGVMPEAKELVAKKYGNVQSSGLAAEVTAEGPNDFKFDVE